VVVRPPQTGQGGWLSHPFFSFSFFNFFYKKNYFILIM
jgi:hypothetical protein